MDIILYFVVVFVALTLADWLNVGAYGYFALGLTSAIVGDVVLALLRRRKR